MLLLPLDLYHTTIRSLPKPKSHLQQGSDMLSVWLPMELLALRHSGWIEASLVCTQNKTVAYPLYSAPQTKHLLDGKLPQEFHAGFNDNRKRAHIVKSEKGKVLPEGVGLMGEAFLYLW